ncbi:MAG: fused MFS/spermidine synthase [Limisphaerales bacterium]
MPVLFALTLALGAGLLFAVQPLAARAALPILGGTPAVWNTSMVFFQAVVLGGYAAAHGLARRASPTAQAVLFVAVITLAAFTLPPQFADLPDTPPERPLTWLLGRLTAQVALPCLALALGSPLLQRWYARATGDSQEPYFLYSASNAGSLGALLAYPVVIEPFLDIDRQARFWTLALLAWGFLVLATAVIQTRSPKRRPHGQASPPSTVPAPSTEPDGTGATTRPAVVLAWIGLGAVPASLLQGCTLFLTTDVASVPLLWVVPLALYLGTFIVAFARRGASTVAAANRALPFLAAALVYVILSRATQPVTVLMTLHLAFLFLAGVVCHGRLVAIRPPARHLTGFYLAMAVGGVLGGAFTALIAPRIFSTVAEYPLAIALACLALPARPSRNPRPTQISPPTPPAARWLRALATASVIAAAMAALGVVAGFFLAESPRLRDALVFGPPAVACCALLDRPRRLALAVAAVFGVGLWLQGLWSSTVFAERNFFGITRVTRNPVARSHQIVHGNTIHGRQFQDPERRSEPLAYYHRHGPLGSVFEAFRSSHAVRAGSETEPARVGVIGLGAGSMAAYARPGERWTFFEIDPAVIRVARDPRWFTFLDDAKADSLEVVEGDARLRLREQPDAAFDLLVLDAFSSDAIPVHLLTREALQLYLLKLRPGGWLLAHISNRYLNLEPVFDSLARDAGIVCRSADDSNEDPALGKEPSHWILLARAERDLGPLARRIQWIPAEGGKGLAPWTDRRAGILEVFEWRFD